MPYFLGQKSSLSLFLTYYISNIQPKLNHKVTKGFQEALGVNSSYVFPFCVFLLNLSNFCTLVLKWPFFKVKTVVSLSLAICLSNIYTNLQPIYIPIFPFLNFLFVCVCVNVQNLSNFHTLLVKRAPFSKLKLQPLYLSIYLSISFSYILFE